MVKVCGNRGFEKEKKKWRTGRERAIIPKTEQMRKNVKV